MNRDVSDSWKRGTRGNREEVKGMQQYTLQQYRRDRAALKVHTIDIAIHHLLDKFYHRAPTPPHQSLALLPSYQPVADWVESYFHSPIELSNNIDRRFIDLVHSTVSNIAPLNFEPYYGTRSDLSPIVGRYARAIPLSSLLPTMKWSDLQRILEQLVALFAKLKEIHYTHNQLIADNVLIVDDRPVLRNLQWSYFVLPHRSSKEVLTCSYAGVAFDHGKIEEGCAYHRSNPGNDLYVLLRSIHQIRPFPELSFLTRMVESLEKIESLPNYEPYRSFQLALEPRESIVPVDYYLPRKTPLQSGLYNISPELAELLERERRYHLWEQHRNDPEKLLTLING